MTKVPFLLRSRIDMGKDDPSLFGKGYLQYKDTDFKDQITEKIGANIDYWLVQVRHAFANPCFKAISCTFIGRHY